MLGYWGGSQELEGKEAQQLGSLAKDKAIDKGIGKRAGVLSLWWQLLSSVKDTYPFKEELVNSQSKWTTIEGGIQYLRELAMVEVMYNDLTSKTWMKCSACGLCGKSLYEMHRCHTLIP